MKINVVDMFTETPGGRTKAEGDFSGEEFREKILLPVIEKLIDTEEKIEIDLDGGYGYGSSFLEEVFGGLIRELILRSVSSKEIKDVINRIFIKSDDEPALVSQIFEYMKCAIEEGCEK